MSPAELTLPPPVADPPVEPVRSRARAEILRLQRQLYRRQKALIEERVHGYTPAFRAYEARFERGVRRYERVAPMSEVVREALQSELVHVGDYHTLGRAQRAFVDLVGQLVDSGRRVVLALELFEARHQREVDRFVAGRLTERAFLERIGYARRHAFDVWPNFRPILELAKEKRLTVVALERARPAELAVRDRFFASRLARAVREHPGAVVASLVGQLHLAKEHLPAEVTRALAKSGIRPRQLAVYQNAEAVWFRLEREGLELSTEAVKVAGGAYCLVNTSPLIAQQSYLDFVEGGELVEVTQPEQHFKELARFIARFLGLEIGDALERVEVYTARDLSFLERLEAEGRFSPRELGLIRRQILARESYYIPRAHIAYLANLSMNHAAEEAAHFLRHVVTGDDEPERDLVDSFYARALEEALAFFGSKLVNPRRKAPRLELIERRARSGDRAERRWASLVVAHLALEQGRRRRVRRLYATDVDLFNSVTHALGYLLGDKLHYALVTGELPLAEARRLFVEPFDGEGEPIELYFRLARRFGHVVVPRLA